MDNNNFNFKFDITDLVAQFLEDNQVDVRPSAGAEQAHLRFPEEMYSEPMKKVGKWFSKFSNNLT